jgi:hypothetical protein
MRSFNQTTDTARPQLDFIERLRSESVVGPDAPLCLNFWFPRPEKGPTVNEYYKAKHRRGEVGRFYPLHHSSRPQV